MGVDDSPPRCLMRIEESLLPQKDVVLDYEACFREKLQGTGEWIYRDASFKAWETGEMSVLWLSGPPGCGKSHLAAQMIQHLTSQTQSNNVAYFFCRDNMPSRRMFSNILKTLVWQFARSDAAYSEVADKICSGDDSDVANMSIATLWETFLPHCPEGFIVIDGMDEAYQDDVDAFLEAVSTTPGSFKILLAGRPELDGKIDAAFGSRAGTIHITKERNNEDISRYIDYQIDRSAKLKTAITPEFRGEIKAELCRAANGMFLWVNLMVSELTSKSQDGESRMRETLKSLPQDLTEAYIRTLYRYSKVLNSYSINNLNKLLAWVLCATRPLTLLELQEVLNMDNSIAEPADQLDLETNVRRNYSTFLTIIKMKQGKEVEEIEEDEAKGADENTAENTDESATAACETPAGQKNLPPPAPRIVPKDIVVMSSRELNDRFRSLSLKLCHASLGDFFRSRTSMTCAVGTTGTKANVWLLQTCLEVMHPEKVKEPWYKHWPELYPYATHSWYKHLADLDVARISDEDKVKLTRALCDYFSTGDSFIHYADTYRWDETPYDQELPYFSSLKALLTDPAVREAFKEDAVVSGWISYVSSSDTVERFLEPIAKACGRHWLQIEDSNHHRGRPSIGDVWFCFYIAWSYLKKRYLIKKSDQGRKRGWRIYGQKYPVEDIYQVAEWANVDRKGAPWHLGIAAVLYGSQHYEEARDECYKALALEPNSREAMLQISQIYEREAYPQRDGTRFYPEETDPKRPELEEAIKWLRKAHEAGTVNRRLQKEGRKKRQEKLPQESKEKAIEKQIMSILSNYLSHVAYLEEKLDGPAAKKNTLRMRMESDPSSADAAYDYLKMVSDEEFLKQLHAYEEEKPGRFTYILGRESAKGMNSLEMMVHDMSTDMVMNRFSFGQRFMDAAHKLGEGDFFVMAMERFIKYDTDHKRQKGWSEEQIRFGRHSMYDDWAREKLAMYYLFYTGETEKGVEQLEKILEGTIDPSAGSRLTMQQEYAACLLASLYFDKAAADKANLPKLEKFAAEPELMREMPDLQAKVNGLVANAHRIHGNPPVAESIMKKEIHRLFNELEKAGDEIENGEGKKVWLYPSSMMRISRALFAVGDDLNGGIAHWLASSLPPELRQHEPDLENDPFYVAPEKKRVYCAGLCPISREWEDMGRQTDKKTWKKQLDGYYQCLYCFDRYRYEQEHSLRFCNECFPKLMDGSLDYKFTVCRPEHKFYHRAPGLSHQTEDGKTWVGAGNEPVDQVRWLRELMEKWEYKSRK